MSPKDPAQQPVAEFRRLVEVADLPEEDQRLTLTATTGELAALAKRFGVLRLDGLEAAALVRRIGGDKGEAGARARVTFHAAVVQSSVVTLEPVKSRIDETFEVDFLPNAGPEAREGGDRGVAAEGAATDEAWGEEVSNMDAPEPPGEVVDGKFDLGEMIAEYLSLAIDPYPRKPGEEFGEWHDPADAGGQQQEGPFAALKNWRSRA